MAVSGDIMMFFKKKKVNEQNNNEALYDYLTGMANRRGLYEYFDNLSEGESLHAMFIDIDNFKRVNDVYGHSMGDLLLVEISKLIHSQSNGFCARVGGDEYVVFIEGDISEEQVIRRAESMIEGMSSIDFRRDVLSLVSLSVGIVLNQSADMQLDDILNKCDSAMYQAKYDGKNRYSIYRDGDAVYEMNKNIEREMDIALKQGEFKVYLQPKVNMVSSKIVGAEALSRWHHPTEGVRTPVSYIPIFEKNGFISQLDMYMFEEVCRIKNSWKGTDYEHIPISINMSRLHLYDKDFPDTVLIIARKYGIPPVELELEITESVFIKDNEELIRVVNQLKEREFLVSIDDFGSGFSALNLLKDISVDIIKIDKEFLRLSSDNWKGKKVIRNVIAMCRDLKLEVVTEGVETKEQIDFLTRCGCQIAQGYYYSKPMSIDDFEIYAKEHLTNTINSFTFSFDGTYKAEECEYEGVVNGEGLEFVDGIYEGSKAIRFPGGDVEMNTVFIPPEVISNDSYTISMWIRPMESHLWTSALYVKFETGFASVIPEAWEGQSNYRIRDSRDVSGWYDISGVRLREGCWTHYAITYNAITEKAVAYINGDVVGSLDNVPANRYVKWIILGGDVFQRSFIGDICELKIYNEAKDYVFMKELHKSYVSKMK